MGERLYAASGTGPGLIIDVATGRTTPLTDGPVQLSSAAGDRRGGCWFAGRSGHIHFADPQGQWFPQG